MAKNKVKQNNVSRSSENAAIDSASYVYDYSNMSLDELLESVRSDIGMADVAGVGKADSYSSETVNSDAAGKTDVLSGGSPIVIEQSAAPQKPAVQQKPTVQQKPATPHKPAVPPKTTAPQKATAPQKPAVPQKPATQQKPTAQQKPAVPKQSDLQQFDAPESVVSQPTSQKASTKAQDSKKASPPPPVEMPRSKRWDESAGSLKASLKKKRRYRFYKGLLVFLIVMLTGIGIGTVFFWRYIEAYEQSLPENVIASLREDLNQTYWESRVESALLPLLNEFEQESIHSKEPYLSRIRDVQYTIRNRTDESTDELLVYTVRAGAWDIGTVHLIPTEDIGFGFKIWEVDSIDLLETFVDSLKKSVSVTVSQNARIEINGMPVSQEYRTDCEHEHGATYFVDGFYGDVDVSVFEFNGQRSRPDFAEKGEYLYPIIIPFSRSYNVVVPEGTAVYVDNSMVPQGRITENMIIPDIFDGYMAPENVPNIKVRYEFELDGLYVEPVVTAISPDGEPLSFEMNSDGVMMFIEEYSLEYKELYESTVDTFIRAYVRFGANLGNDIDANFANLSRYMLYNSDLYIRVARSMEGVMWVSNTIVDYHALSIDNFRQYGEQYFSCEVRYSITQRTYYETREVEGNYEILFVLSGGRWLAAKMLAIPPLGADR